MVLILKNSVKGRQFSSEEMSITYKEEIAR